MKEAFWDKVQVDISKFKKFLQLVDERWLRKIIDHGDFCVRVALFPMLEAVTLHSNGQMPVKLCQSSHSTELSYWHEFEIGDVIIFCHAIGSWTPWYQQSGFILCNYVVPSDAISLSIWFCQSHCLLVMSEECWPFALMFLSAWEGIYMGSAPCFRDLN